MDEGRGYTIKIIFDLWGWVYTINKMSLGEISKRDFHNSGGLAMSRGVRETWLHYDCYSCAAFVQLHNIKHHITISGFRLFFVECKATNVSFAV